MSLILVACALFGIGLLGVLVRRDIIALLASVEVMLGGAVVLLVGLGASVKQAGTPVSVEGVALVVIVVAAAEAAVGLALLVAVARRRGTTRIDDLNEVKG
jgi:NADH-quinone oxidoreductase subunit K